MNSSLRSVLSKRYLILIIFFILAYSLFAQQPGTRPVIQFISPSAGDSLNNTGFITVSAEIVSVTPLQSFRIINNSETVVDETGLNPEKKDEKTYVISSSVSLIKGLNSIIIEAKNSAGTAYSEIRRINNHPEPFITWLSPALDSANFESGVVNLEAEIKTNLPLQDVTIILNGFLKPQNLSRIIKRSNDIYVLVRPLQLKSGKNAVYITAHNKRGECRSVTRTIYFGEPPVISLTSPLAKDSINTSGLVTVIAEIRSSTPLQSFRIVNNEITAANEIVMKPEKKDSITYVIGSNIPLRKGQNIVYVEAKNAVGKAISEKHIIIVSNAFIASKGELFIKWLSPAEASSETESGIVNIRAEIRSSLDLQNVNLNLNGRVLAPEEGEITRSNDSIYIFERTLKNILAAKNTVLITASNIGGTTVFDSRTINYSTGAKPVTGSKPVAGSKPVITITSTDSLNNSGFILFSAEIVSSTKLQAIRVVQNNYIVANASSKIPEQTDSITYVLKRLIPLSEGKNILYVEAKNSFGTARSERHTIICRPEPRITWISPPSAISAEETGMLKIKAEIFTSFDLLNIGVTVNDILLFEKKEGISRVANDKYILEQNVPLKNGENNIILTAANARGKGYSSKRTVNYMPGVITKNETAILTNDKSEKAEIKLQGNNQIPEPKIAATESSTVKPEESSKEPLSGAVTSEETVVKPVDTSAVPAAPIITWISPSRQYMDLNQNSARIRVTLKSPDNLQSVLVYINDVASEDLNQVSAQSTAGDYILEKSIILRPGENNIYVIATNSRGTTRSETRYLTNPPANPPTISWAVPADPNTMVNSEVVVVEACIKSATELKEVKILVNGIQQSSDMMFQAPIPGDCNYRIAKSVILKDGDNSIYIIADNYAGSMTSDKRVIRFQTGIAEKRLALVIGNSDYGGSMVLRNSVNDANLIEGTLKSLGFEVIKRLDATRNVMMDAVRDFSRKLTEYNVALFYYAGHGVQVDGENYLIPTDAMLNEKDDCKWEAVPVNFIVEEFEKVPENINIVILDACRNNPFRSWARGGSEGFRALNAVTGTIIGYATSENSTAADGAGANGTYTEELAKQMVIPQSISNVFINTRKQVLLRTNNNQRPQEWNMLTGDFFFKK